jgi:ABC-type branched-subunit amino acid transport system substrate-binding protein
MSYLKYNLGYKLTALFLILILVVPILFACGQDKGKYLSPTPIATPIATLTPTSAPTTPSPTTLGNPVKIGAISSWSGPAAITGMSFVDPILKLVEKQVKDQGGILGGRDVKFIKYDNRFSVADVVAGAKKLILEDKVSVVLYADC